MQISKRLVGRVVVAMAVGFGALPAAASAACPIEPTSQPFVHLGDTNEYFLAPGGDFEETLVWSTTGNAAVVASDPNGIDSGVRAAALGQNASFTSPRICLDADRPHMRLAVRARTAGGTLRLDALDEAGTKTLLAKFEAPEYGTWRATPFVALTTPLGIGEGQWKSVRLRLTALNGDWLADAVYVDPYKRG